MHGGDVWMEGEPAEWRDFSANLRPEGAPDWVLQAIGSALKDIARYPDPRMRRATRGLAAHLGVPEACVVPTAGGVAALELAASLDARGTLIPVPCFSEYGRVARKRGLWTEASPLSPAAIRRRLFPDCLVFLANPNNPTGTAFEPREMLELLDDVEAFGGWLVVDEAFVEYCPQYSLRDRVQRSERLIVIGSMTKILGIPGVRLGYLLAPEATASRLRDRQRPWEVSCFATAVAAALPGRAAFFRREAERNARRREGLTADLRAIGVGVRPSTASFLLCSLDRSAHDVALQFRRRRILVRECGDFAGLEDDRHLRVAVKDEDANRLLVSAFEACLKV